MKNKYHIKPGDRFGKLTCIRFDHVGNHYRSYFLFKCDCGNEKIILGSGVISGNTKSCGCLSKEIKLSKRLPDDLGVKRQIILQYKRHALNRKISYDISESDFIKLLSENCFYCGLKPSNIKKTKNHNGFIYSGVDRINSKAGYIKENCVSCCEQCNKAKGNMSTNEFVTWIKRAYNAMAAQWG